MRYSTRIARSSCTATSPSNILVTADGTPKLLDFGIATLSTTDGAGDADATLLGATTPSYASPEQLRGKRVTTASDTYSLGVVLYRLLCGVPPHELTGLSPAEIEQRVTREPPAPPSTRAPADRAREIRGDLDTIVLNALRTDPDELTAAEPSRSCGAGSPMSRSPRGAPASPIAFARSCAGILSR